VPVFIAAKTPVQPCGAGLDCVSAQPASDQVRGNISLGEALKILSERGDQARDIAAAARRRMES
jgi:conjugal transfer pilus assembly protein TrbC